MKRNIKNMAFALLTLFAVTSCDLLEDPQGNAGGNDTVWLHERKIQF